MKINYKIKEQGGNCETHGKIKDHLRQQTHILE